jgi:hypothetical protein
MTADDWLEIDDIDRSTMTTEDRIAELHGRGVEVRTIFRILNHEEKSKRWNARNVKAVLRGLKLIPQQGTTNNEPKEAI